MGVVRGEGMLDHLEGSPGRWLVVPVGERVVLAAAEEG